MVEKVVTAVLLLALLFFIILPSVRPSLPDRGIEKDKPPTLDELRAWQRREAEDDYRSSLPNETTIDRWNRLTRNIP